MNVTKAVLIALTLVGAFVAQADEPKYGGICFTAGVEIDGVSYPDGTTVYAETWPTQMVVKPIVPEGKTFVCFSMSGGIKTIVGNSYPSRLFPNKDGYAYITPAYQAGTVTTYAPQYANFVKWVDASSDGSDTAGDGSKEKPWHTLQHAVDSVPNTLGIIIAKKGVYKEGGTDTTQGVTAGLSWNRVSIPDTKNLLIKSELGASETAIEGLPDYDSYPEATGGDKGCGPNAYRCVSFGFNNGGSGSAIQGFTLRNGYAGHGGNWDTAGYAGGVLAQRSGVGLSLNQVLDCVISNCSAHARAALSDVYAFRCHVADIRNVYSGQGPCSGSYLVSCLCEEATAGGATKGIHNSCKDSWPQTSWNSCADSFWLGAYEYFGSVMRGGSWSGPIGVTRDSLIYVDDANGDFRLDADSKGYGGTRLPDPEKEEEATYWTNWVNNYAALATSDLDGCRIIYVDGVPVSGALMNVVKRRRVYVDLPADIGMDLTGVTANETNKLEAGAVFTMKPNATKSCDAVAVVLGTTTNWFANLPGGTYTHTVPADFDPTETDVFTFLRGKSQPILVTIPSAVGVDATGITPGEVTYFSSGKTFSLTPNETKSRYALGVVCGGVTNFFLQLPDRTFTYTVPEDFDESQQLDFVVLVSNDWYVSPTGDNSNNGFTPTSPWRTLCYAMYKCQSGQRVLALPGVYAEGVTDRDGHYPTPSSDIPNCRVAGKRGCVLESTDGPEKTIIMGAPSTDPSADACGNGPGAVGCVRMTSAVAGYEEVVRGFTLTGGRSGISGNPSAGDTCGSAHFALWSSDDCAIIENCIITNNYSFGGTLAGGSIVGCVIADNYLTSGATNSGTTAKFHGTLVKNGVASDLHALRNSTIGKEASFGMRSNAEYLNCVNCLIMGTVKWHSNDMTFTNCVFSHAVGYKKVDCIVTNAEAIAVDENYVPTNKAGVVVDYAGTKYWSSPYLFACNDARGGQRVYNGSLDVGAVEYDWRKDYAKDLAKRNQFAVSKASPAVVESDAKTVRVPAGASVKGAWTAAVLPKTASVKVRIDGTGTFKVKVGGVAVATLAGPVATVTNVEFPAEAGKTVEFAYDGEDGYAEILKTGLSNGLVLFVR